MQSPTREPFRLFFLAGLAASVIGVALWPLFYWGMFDAHPGLAHSRLMTFGFLGAFMAGFLTTAGPRLLDAPPLHLLELVALILLWAGGVVCCLAGRIEGGDLFFAAFLIALLAMLLFRFLRRRDVPPPCTTMVPIGLLCGIAGLALLIQERSTPELSPFRFFLARELAYEAMFLLPILGTAPYLLPRFLGLPGRHDFPSSPTPPPGWWPKALWAVACSLLLLGAWTLEAAGYVRLAPLLLGVIAGAYLLREIPLFRRSAQKGTLALNLRIATLATLVGLVVGALAPIYRVPFNHWLFIAGFGFLVLSVAARVALGHAERKDLIGRRSGALIAVMVLVLLAAATRMFAEPIPKIMISHHIYAALSWIAAALVWALVIFPFLVPTRSPRAGSEKR